MTPNEGHGRGQDQLREKIEFIFEKTSVKKQNSFSNSHYDNYIIYLYMHYIINYCI